MGSLSVYHTGGRESRWLRMDIGSAAGWRPAWFGRDFEREFVKGAGVAAAASSLDPLGGAAQGASSDGTRNKFI